MHGLDQHTGSARAGVGQLPVNDEGLQAPQASPTCDPLVIMEDMLCVVKRLFHARLQGVNRCKHQSGEQASMQANSWDG